MENVFIEINYNKSQKTSSKNKKTMKIKNKRIQKTNEKNYEIKI